MPKIKFLPQSQHLIQIPRERYFAPVADVSVDIGSRGDVRVTEPFLDIVDTPTLVHKDIECYGKQLPTDDFGGNTGTKSCCSGTVDGAFVGIIMLTCAGAVLLKKKKEQ